MKIVCDSCGAKYSIADEKVAGKVFKIRCKKCSSVIVVRGDQVAAEEEASTRVFDYGSDAVWHVVVNGEQQGPFVPSQIGSLLSEGTIDWEAYVWREGFDGWKSARDIPELVDAITGGAGSQSGAEAPTPAISPSSPPMGADPFAQTEAAGSAFGGGGGGYAAQEPFPATQQASPFAQEQAFAAPREGAAVARRNAGADLFAQADASPFAGADTDDVVSSPPAAAATARVDSLTGQRNENSVLFSLANLQALATGTGGPAKSGGPAVAAPAAAPTGRAPGEGSGLIDIRALASAGTGAPASSGRTGDVDDLLSIGAGPAPLGSPVLAPVAEGEGKGKYLLVGGLAFAGALVVALGVVVVILASQSPDEVAAAENPATGDITPTAGPTTGEDSAPEPTGAPTGENPAPTGGGTDPSGTGTPPVAEEEREPSRPLTAEERRRLEQRREQERERRANEPARPAATPTSMEASTPRGNSDIDALLDKALGGGGGGREQPARMEETAAAPPAGGGGGGLSDTPPRGAVLSAMQGISGAVRSCGGGQHGVANVRVTVQGSSGRVTNAVVSGQFSGTPVGSCIARAARGARFPRFANPTFSVSFPYRL